MYYAHIRWDDRGAAIASQTVAEHLSGTAALSRAFAEAFGAGDDGELIGLLHDLGKCTDGFQNRLLRDGPRVDNGGRSRLLQILWPVRGRGLYRGTPQWPAGFWQRADRLRWGRNALWSAEKRNCRTVSGKLWRERYDAPGLAAGGGSAGSAVRVVPDADALFLLGGCRLSGYRTLYGR